LKEADELDAINALPKHIASSPFKCTPRSCFPVFSERIS